MQALIEDLLSYSKAGTQALERRAVCMNDVLKPVLANLAASIEESGASVTVEPLPAVEGDEKLLAQVLQNLISNAIKFHKPGEAPIIRISACQRDEEWVFAIADDGIGFEEQYRDRIFQAFQRLHGSGQYGGSGIGLAICRRIIDLHGGKLWASSSPGAGATF